MATFLTLQCGNGTAYDELSQTLICDTVGPNVTYGTAPDYPSLTTPDIISLLSLALGVWAMAWGFRMVGSLIYKSS